MQKSLGMNSRLNGKDMEAQIRIFGRSQENKQNGCSFLAVDVF